MHKSLHGRTDLREEPASTNALARDLGLLAKRHGLQGVVMLSFKADRVGVNSSGDPLMFALAMERLGDQLLAAIADGKFDPDPQLEASLGLSAGRG